MPSWKGIPRMYKVVGVSRSNSGARNVYEWVPEAVEARVVESILPKREKLGRPRAPVKASIDPEWAFAYASGWNDAAAKRPWVKDYERIFGRFAPVYEQARQHAVHSRYTGGMRLPAMPIVFDELPKFVSTGIRFAREEGATYAEIYPPSFEPPVAPVLKSGDQVEGAEYGARRVRRARRPVVSARLGRRLAAACIVPEYDGMRRNVPSASPHVRSGMAD